MRAARWLWATALILSVPAAAIEPDVTGSIRVCCTGRVVGVRERLA